MKLKNTITIIVLIIALLIGLSLLLYPTVSNMWNESRQSRAIATYLCEVEDLDENQYTEIMQSAIDYNDSLANRAPKYVLSGDEQKKYENLLNIGGSGILGYIEIPSINCYLPIYHGTDSSVMQVGVGHLEWTSLPVGGAGTHCVLTGHRGLPSAKLFTNIDKLSEGDTFIINVLDKVLTYEVDRILIVEPSEIENLRIVEGEDYCTLVTCTPYGVNTHRLLVRGRRVTDAEYENEVRVTADAVQIEPLIVAPIVAAPIFLVLVFAIFLADRNKRLNRKKRRG